MGNPNRTVPRQKDRAKLCAAGRRRGGLQASPCHRVEERHLGEECGVCCEKSIVDSTQKMNKTVPLSLNKLFIWLVLYIKSLD